LPKGESLPSAHRERSRGASAAFRLHVNGELRDRRLLDFFNREPAGTHEWINELEEALRGIAFEASRFSWG